ncbi:MAG: SIS domain-containing protein [Chloroflexota bacterium]
MSLKTSAMLQQVHGLADMLWECFQSFDEESRRVLDSELCVSAKRILITGCGDSHHAALGARLAFHTIAGVPCEALSSLQFSRYTAPFLYSSGSSALDTDVVIGISVSGEVARTIEALRLAGKAGATAVALTGSLDSRIARSAQVVLKTVVPPFPSAAPIPGVRSYAASLMMLYLSAIQVGQMRGTLTAAEADQLRGELSSLPLAIAETVSANEERIKKLAEDWADASEFVFVGGGPNYGTALFSAAKILEASGDPAVGQDTEEWAHLQYFAREPRTPTFFIVPEGRSSDRAGEVAVAAKAIGRRVVAIVPEGEQTISAQADVVLPVMEGVREAFSPLLYCLATELFAAYRAQVLDEPFFRDFSGGRSVKEGGGISRIQSSVIQEETHP